MSVCVCVLCVCCVCCVRCECVVCMCACLSVTCVYVCMCECKRYTGKTPANTINTQTTQREKVVCLARYVHEVMGGARFVFVLFVVFVLFGCWFVLLYCIVAVVVVVVCCC